MSNKMNHRQTNSRRNRHRNDVKNWYRMADGNLYGHRPDVKDDQITDYYTTDVGEVVALLRAQILAEIAYEDPNYNDSYWDY